MVLAFQYLKNVKNEVLNETLMNIFRNYIPNKKFKCNYCQPQRSKRSKLTKSYYKHSQKKRTKKNYKQKLHIGQRRY